MKYVTRIIVDPDRFGATLWYDNIVRTIQGEYPKIADMIYNLATTKYINTDTGESFINQDIEIYIDALGIGARLYYMFKDKGLEVHKIKRVDFNRFIGLDMEQPVVELDDDSFVIKRECLRMGIN
nr:MAG TPA: hypothetical protein [Caudoviricetes sp.]